MVSGELWKPVGDYSGVNDLMVDSITRENLMVSGVDDRYNPFADLWDLSSGELLRKLNPLDYPNTYSGEAYCVRDEAGKHIACGGSPLQIFDAATGALIYSNKAQTGNLIWAISPDGNTLASCTIVYKGDMFNPVIVPDDLIFLQDLSTSTPQLAGSLDAQEKGICSPMVFSPDSQYLASTSGFIWKMDEHKALASFPPAGYAPMAFSPDSSLLVYWNRVIDAGTGNILKELAVNGYVKMVGFDPDRLYLVIHTDQGVEYWGVR